MKELSITAKGIRGGLLSAKNKRLFAGAAALIIYAVIIFIGVLNHEYWFDEAQAWNIARDNSISGIFSMLKYEGHPPLWFLLLHILTSLGLPCESMGFLCWGMSVLSAALILFCFPVKPYFKAAMIFCSGMLFVNSVIARSYCLINFLLCMIAVVYPKRKAHPLLFGLLVALIANTHLCMSGLAGILGVYMLVDLIKDRKTNTKKQNIFNLLSAAVVGAGAAVLILPLLGALSSNNFAANKVLTAEGMIRSALNAPLNTLTSCIAPNLWGIHADIMLAAAQLCALASLIVIRHKRRTFIITLVFTLFYIAVCEVIWHGSPNRGNVFVFTLAAIFVMGHGEKSAGIGQPKERKDNGGLAEKLKRIDSDPKKTVTVLLSLLLAFTIPSGAKYYIQDIKTQFVPSKSAADYLKANVGDNDLVVTYYDDAAQIIAYLPQRKFYSIAFDEFYSFNFHKEPEGMCGYSEFCGLAAEYDGIYYVSRSAGLDIQGIEPLYESFEYIPFILGEEQVRIWRVSADDLEIFFNV
ncbi:MAG: hypothetical protein NC394_08285 [Bacteroides sp.]|nr:hypothetical protein [Bacteroides sp.]